MGKILLSGIIPNWLVYFYQPDTTAIEQGPLPFQKRPSHPLYEGCRLPQAVVADIAPSDSVLSGTNREGMFYAARTFAFKLGQSLAMLIFTAVSTIGAAAGIGYRIAAFIAAIFCLVGGLIFMTYNEKKVEGIISR